MTIREAVIETIRRGLRIAFSLPMLSITKHLILLKMLGALIKDQELFKIATMPSVTIRTRRMSKPSSM